MIGTSCFLYRSTCTASEPKLACRAILAEARQRNLLLDLTGYLHFEDGVFYQWLEGPAASLAQVEALIRRDPRHRDMHFLFRGTQDSRKFADWQMGFAVSDPGTLFEWVANKGVSPMDRARFASGILEFMEGAQAEASRASGRG